MTNIHEQVNDFLGDPRVQAVRDLARESRSLKICYPNEVPVSRFLAWLLDPTQGHGLQDGVLRGLFAAAWGVRSGYDIPLTVRRFLSPTAVEAASFDDCLVDREVALDGNRLDVLVLEPKERWLLAIEHKYGAREGPGQLANYRASLEAMYPGWRQVLIFLDYDGQAPSADGWIGLDYEWLVRELKTAESSPWIATSCQAVIRDFRDAIDWDAREFIHISDEQLLEVVNAHRAVFEQMRRWSRVKQTLTNLSSELYESSDSLDAKATQQLFKVFWQRRFLWEACIPMLAYARMLKVARESFPDIEHWTSRKCVYFHLPEWSEFDSADERTEEWSVGVRVRPLANEEQFGPNSFGVLSYVVPRRLAPALQAQPVLERIAALRASSMRKRAIAAGLNHYSVKAQRPVSEAQVGSVLVAHLEELHLAFAEILALAK